MMSRRERMIEVGEAAAVDLFVSTLNPKTRTDTWDWGTFEEKAALFAERQVKLQTTRQEWDKHRASMAGDARGAAQLMARRLLRMSAIQEWWSQVVTTTGATNTVG